MVDSIYPIALASSAEKCAKAMENLTQKIHQTTEAFQQQATKLKKIPLSKETAGERHLANAPANSVINPTIASTATSGERLPVLQSIFPSLSSAMAEVTRFTDASTKLAEGLNEVVDVVEEVKQGAGAFKEVKKGIGNLLDSFTFDKEKSSGSMKNSDRQKSKETKQNSGPKRQNKAESSKQQQSTRPQTAGSPSLGKVGELLEAIQSGMDLIDFGADVYARFSGKETSESKGETKLALPQTSAAQSSFIKSTGGSSVTSEVKTAPVSGAVSTIATGLTEAAGVFQEIEKGVGAVKQIKESVGSVLGVFKPNEESSPNSSKTPNAKKSMDRTIKRAVRSIDRLNRTIRSSNMGSAAGRGRRGGKKRGEKGRSYNRNTTNRLPNAGYQTSDKYSAKTVKTSLPAAGKATGFNRIKGLMKTLGSGAGKLFRPLNAVMQVPELASAIATGDSKEIGATAGNVAGGMGGAAAGALAGAAIGSVVPIIGTAVGGLIGSVVGGMGGSSIGEWAGSKVGGWFSEDKTDQPVPDAVSHQTKQLQEGNKAIHFAPIINLTPTGNPAYDQDVSNQVIERLKAEFAQGIMPNMDVATRADASLSDNRSS
ncbi:hypothetical protein [Marinomonas transparens]|uniref:Uncharacterized protein n=1 Tax=Marinomonas transparens TaxID=2795388 RepID=A0A934JN88_9GAMM|nr:hypothetical protein [Marinomonas transparens]MBJ7536628.1 hypothetical protein [Marinomonas transparens]